LEEEEEEEKKSSPNLFHQFTSEEKGGTGRTTAAINCGHSDCDPTILTAIITSIYHQQQHQFHL